MNLDIYKEIKNNIFIFFIILLFIFYNLFIIRDVKILFFIIIISIIAYILYDKRKTRDIVKDRNKIEYIDNIEKQLNHDYEIPENKIYHIHKTPRNIKYIKKNEDIKNIIYDLKFLQIYNKELYEKFISYFEYFLKIHYNVMLEKYDYRTYFSILKDIRNEILNIMKSIYFNVPKISTIIDIPDLDKYIEKRILIIQSITYKYMKIAYNKYSQDHVTYNAPFEYDSMKDDRYDLF